MTYLLDNELIFKLPVTDQKNFSLIEQFQWQQWTCDVIQGSYPFSETNFQDFSKTFQGLRLIFQGL